MSKSVIDICDEAIAHCRWKSILKRVLENDISLESYINKGFEEIFESVYNICKEVKGIGLLSVYDIVSAICRYYSINIDFVYIIGGGPVRAAKLLNLKTKTKKIGKILLKYVTIEDVISSFQKNDYQMNEYIKTSTNGDEFESYICNWQKNIE
jgi:hypothetical protein